MSKSPPKKQRLNEAPPAGTSEAAATAAWVESTKMPFPRGLPMESEYDEREFYVRACYPKYYKIVLRLLKNRKTRVVTVTGTPGIGKSLFYAYFLKRFSFEAKEATIITVSFNRESVMKKVAVWEGGDLMEEATKSKMEDLIKAEAKARATNKLIYLVDGRPKIHPEDAQSVVFASPNDAWFKYIRKNSTRPMVIMPLWTFEELKTAAIELDLTMDALQDDDGDDKIIADDIFREKTSERGRTLVGGEEKAGVSDEDVPVAPMVADLVEQRFHIFGGVARACLSTDEQFVKNQQDSIEAIITTFKDSAKLRALLDQEKEHEKMYHRICYFVPKENNVREYTIAQPTPFVKQLLVKLLLNLTKSQREIIIDLLMNNPAAASFRGTLFEISVHDQLNSGCRFEARALDKEDSKKMHTFECARLTPQVAGKTWCYFDENFSASVLSSGPHHVPTSKRFASVDSFYYEETPRVLGQRKADEERVANGLTFGQLRRFLSDHDKEQEKLKQGKRGESSLKDVLEAIPQFVWGVGTSEEEGAEES